MAGGFAPAEDKDTAELMEEIKQNFIGIMHRSGMIPTDDGNQ